MSLDFAKEVNNTFRIDEHFNKLYNFFKHHFVLSNFDYNLFTHKNQ